MYLSVVIPSYNEEKRLSHTVKRVVSLLEQIKKSYEIIIVDDGSRDSTRTIAEQLSQSFLRVHVMSYEKNRGKGYAVKTGMLAAHSDFIFYMDADGSTSVRELLKFLPLFGRGADIVIGSRYMPQSSVEVEQPIYRRLLGRFANALIQLLILPGIHDSQCGFKGFTRSAAHTVFSKQTIDRWGFDFEILTIARAHRFIIQEVPVRWLDSHGSRVRPLRAALKTLAELMKVTYKLYLGKYS